jgi:hypothetical protein
MMVAGIVALGAGVARGETTETVPVMYRSSASAFFASEDHNYYVDSELRLPLLQPQPVGVYYHYFEVSPFLDIGEPQVELLHNRYELQADLKLTAEIRLIAVGGYHTLRIVDDTGFASAYVIGAGIGSPLTTRENWLEWSALAGGYVSRRNLDHDWWAELRAAWRFWNFDEIEYGDAFIHPQLRLVAEVETSNDGNRLHTLARLGPDYRLASAFGNTLDFQVRWFYNDGHLFYGSNENGLLVGFNIEAHPDELRVPNAREYRRDGWMPLVWGQYDLATGSSRRVARLEMNIELLDFVLFNHRFTEVIWYESRQEYNTGDLDNITYNVTLGVQTPIALLATPLWNNDPLVFGAEFWHRSDHALNPAAARVPPPPAAGLDNGSHNILPRLRLQTTGWDLPYRDPAMYERRTEWLNAVDWRVTLGLTVQDDRERGDIAGQLGLNWDVITLQGYVVYARGIASFGSETIDWLAELGVRRPLGRVFARFEDYGIKLDIARGETFSVGFGLNL